MVSHSSMRNPQDLIGIRKRLQISQEEMARLLGVSYVSVNRWEGGHSFPSGTTVDLYEAIAAALAAGHSGASIKLAANNERGRFLYSLFRMAYASSRKHA